MLNNQCNAKIERNGRYSITCLLLTNIFCFTILLHHFNLLIHLHEHSSQFNSSCFYWFTTHVSSTATRHVSVSQGPSSGVYIVTRKLFNCGYTDHALSTKYFCFTQNKKQIEIKQSTHRQETQPQVPKTYTDTHNQQASRRH
jgi:hypothetical protein